jgi:hypothetical protein
MLFGDEPPYTAEGTLISAGESTSSTPDAQIVRTVRVTVLRTALISSSRTTAVDPVSPAQSVTADLYMTALSVAPGN